LRQFLSSIPVWLKDKLFLKKLIYDELSKIDEIDKKKIKLLFSEHHLSHAASTFYPSPFKEASILTVDGVGEWATASISYGNNEEIRILKELRFPHSLGLLYSAFTYYAGFKVNSGEYKLMGLAPYGDAASARFKKYLDLINSQLVDIKGDGSVWLNQDYFDYSVGLKMVNEGKWEQLMGLPRRRPETEITQEYCDMALAIQYVTEDSVFKMATEAKRLTGSGNLCMAGGVALNCVANGKLLKKKIVHNLWIQPAAGDAGGALGAALSAYHAYFNKTRELNNKMDNMQGSYLGPEYSSLDIELMARRYKSVYENLSENNLYDRVAELLDNGYVVGWFQGRMEWGPRALGNRSILGDARFPEMKDVVNRKIKFREAFRPFAPSVLREKASEYFDIKEDLESPYMLLVAPVKENKRVIPAVTHVDYSARIQTVRCEDNPIFYDLINEYYKLTGVPVIINTSFNVRGEPIVCKPEEAYMCFMRTNIDYLVMGNFLLNKRSQKPLKGDSDWKKEFELD